MKDLPEHLTKGGPGDESSPGNVNTEAWWQKMSEEGSEIAEKEGSNSTTGKKQRHLFLHYSRSTNLFRNRWPNTVHVVLVRRPELTLKKYH